MASTKATLDCRINVIKPNLSKKANFNNTVTINHILFAISPNKNNTVKLLLIDTSE